MPKTLLDSTRRESDHWDERRHFEDDNDQAADLQHAESAAFTAQAIQAHIVRLACGQVWLVTKSPTQAKEAWMGHPRK
jgi:hypothetical protein